MSVRKFKIKIDGKLFEAEVEELTEGAPAAMLKIEENHKNPQQHPRPPASRHSAVRKNQ